ncbi:PREDICTED: short-chain dehydrogenase [Prunus dulcis]|uniref:PREDICTED: short-chain dehydrogenase n=1 Tax=Prunus dulcis TaxID=3755 RepID=A0A5E4FVQ6_PRUDU|nr:PREDICTED: short-chain dehydrogenase [Prunus dulcis]
MRIRRSKSKPTLYTKTQGKSDIFVALHPQLKGVGGEYFVDCNIAKPSSQAKDADLATRIEDSLVNEAALSCLDFVIVGITMEVQRRKGRGSTMMPATPWHLNYGGSEKGKRFRERDSLASLL